MTYHCFGNLWPFPHLQRRLFNDLIPGECVIASKQLSAFETIRCRRPSMRLSGPTQFRSTLLMQKPCWPKKNKASNPGSIEEVRVFLSPPGPCTDQQVSVAEEGVFTFGLTLKDLVRCFCQRDSTWRLSCRPEPEVSALTGLSLAQGSKPVSQSAAQCATCYGRRRSWRAGACSSASDRRQRPAARASRFRSGLKHHAA